MHQREATVVDMALVQLIRLVRSDDWSPTAAADHLRAALGSDAATVLRHVRSRVQRVRLDRPSVLADRAIETLDAVLADQVTA